MWFPYPAGLLDSLGATPTAQGHWPQVTSSLSLNTPPIKVSNKQRENNIILLVSISTLCAIIILFMTLVVLFLIIVLIFKNQEQKTGEASNISENVYAELEPAPTYEEVEGFCSTTNLTESKLTAAPPASLNDHDITAEIVN